MKVVVFLVEGFEEIEALAPIDILKRGEVEVDIVSINNEKSVFSARKIEIKVDKSIDEINFDEYEMIILPGGPGTDNYYKSELLLEKIKEFSINKKLGAICAAPTVFAKLGLLKNKKAVCFPSCEETLINNGANLVKDKVITDGNITTSKAAGTAIDFSLQILKVLKGKDIAEKIKNQIVY